MIFDKHKCIFIHVPKCAGSSIEQFLNGGSFDSKATNYNSCCGWDNENKIWMQHATAEQINNLYTDKFDEYFKFAIVRNPWDRALSDYFWMQNEIRAKDSFKNFLLLQGRFNDRRLRFPMLNSESRADHFLPQHEFILNRKGEQIVDFVGKFENIKEDFGVICDRISISKTQLPHQNKGKKSKHYTEYYDGETKNLACNQSMLSF
jgi:hypothetical protein